MQRPSQAWANQGPSHLPLFLTFNRIRSRSILGLQWKFEFKRQISDWHPYHDELDSTAVVGLSRKEIPSKF